MVYVYSKIFVSYLFPMYISLTSAYERLLITDKKSMFSRHTLTVHAGYHSPEVVNLHSLIDLSVQHVKFVFAT